MYDMAQSTTDPVCGYIIISTLFVCTLTSIVKPYHIRTRSHAQRLPLWTFTLECPIDSACVCGKCTVAADTWAERGSRPAVACVRFDPENTLAHTLAHQSDGLRRTTGRVPTEIAIFMCELCSAAAAAGGRWPVCESRAHAFACVSAQFYFII